MHTHGMVHEKDMESHRVDNNMESALIRRWPSIKRFINYWDTYPHGVSWQIIRLGFTLAIMNKWYVYSTDFILAFPRVDIKTDIYMRPPQVPNNFKTIDLPFINDQFLKVYKLLENLCGVKDIGHTWNCLFCSSLF